MTLQISQLMTILFISLFSCCRCWGIDKCAVVIPRGAHLGITDPKKHFLSSVVGIPSSPADVCITYAAVEAAFLEASSAIYVAPILKEHDDLTGDDIAPTAEVVLHASRILAHQFKLIPFEVFYFLPQINTIKTSFIEKCPMPFSPMICTPGIYRRIDGLCNNLIHPTWGATRTVFNRLLPPAYSDGISLPKVSVTGGPLPSARLISTNVHTDHGFDDLAITVMFVAWGQLMDHDFTLTGMSLDPLTRNEPEQCCKMPLPLRNPYCFEILIPELDSFHSLFGTKCLDFVRAFPGLRSDCRLGSREQFNLLTGVIDGNTVYGGTPKAARELRAGIGGLLRELRPFQELGLKGLLPLRTEIADEGCIRNSPSQHCFLAGEIRVNEQLSLACFHTILFREHNRIAYILYSLNPHWDDERLYQEARRIVIAEIQHITFNEFLPILLGPDLLVKHNLLLHKKGYWDGYNHEVNPAIVAAFSAAAFRFGHSLLPSTIQRWSYSHKYIASKRLHDLIRQPYDLMKPGLLDEYVMGMANQPAQSMDDAITQEITNHLFEEKHEKSGFDLVALNVQRGRDFGLPGYNHYRKFCGLPPILSFEELSFNFKNITSAKYALIYEHVDDIDLWSGGVSEPSTPGAVLGPTFGCIVAEQMARARHGDRFWYELPNQPSSFTLPQLESVRHTSLARLICDNTDGTDTIQINPLILSDYSANPRVACKSGVLPYLDLSPWKETIPVPLGVVGNNVDILENYQGGIIL